MNFAFGLAGVGYFDANVIHSLKGCLDLVRPFNKNDRAGIAKIVEAYHFELVKRIQSIRIHEVDIQPALILINYDECRAGDALAVLSTRSRRNALNQMGFAAS